MAEVIYTDEFGDWFESLSAEEEKAIVNVVRKLEVLGLQLGYPHSSAIEGAPVAFRELRPKGGESPLRVIYAFDPVRDAVLIIGGDKSNDPKFYDRILPEASKIWQQYLAELRKDTDERKRR
jgi:hypothetical protein